MRADRLLSLLLILQSRGRMKAGDLAERLEVSLRTIYRDLDALSAAGVPVYAERGPGGGCVLRPGYRTDLTGLNDSEIASLFAGTTGGVLDRVGMERALQTALVKLEAALPSERRLDATRARSRVYVDAQAWFGWDESTPHLAALRDAVFDDRRIRLTYARADGRESTHSVGPLGLVVKGGVWYLVASASGDIRVYRVSRIRALTVTNQVFQRPQQFDLATFWTHRVRDFVAGIPEYRATVRVDAATVPLLPQVFGERVRSAIAGAKRHRGGALTLELSFDSLEAACGQLLHLGAGVEALEPLELREALRKTAEAVAKLYTSP